MDDDDKTSPKGRSRYTEPQRFISLVEQLHRQIQQRHTDAHHEEPHEAPLVRETRRLYWVTGVLAFIGACSFGAALLQWDAMRGQLNAFQDSVALDQRPWIGLENLSIAGPLTYDAKGWEHGKRWHITLTYRLKNYGKTPAAHVVFWMHMLPIVLHYQSGGKLHGTFIGDELNAACTWPETSTEMSIDSGQLMFPGDEWPQKRLKLMETNTRLTKPKLPRPNTAAFFFYPCVLRIGPRSAISHFSGNPL
ncbi:MAG TPA: hypothetical protein VGR45_09675 [Stellaceae bacterium]|nr:hypothetical protein [Stellaceae bacterium]